MSRYEVQTTYGDLEEVSERLMEDLRSHLSELRVGVPGQAHFTATHDILRRVARIAVVEHETTTRNAAQRRASEARDERSVAHGRSSPETLWEGDEHALRMLLETGNLPLLLSQLISLQAFEQRSQRRAPLDESTAAMVAGTEVSTLCLLELALQHEEATHSLDLQQLVDYCVVTLQEVIASDYAVIARGRRWIQVPHLLAALGQHIDSLEPLGIVPMLRASNLFSLLVRAFYERLPEWDADQLYAGCRFLAAVCDIETFDEATYMGDLLHERRHAILALRDTYLAGVTSGNMELRRALRPLLDVVRRL